MKKALRIETGLKVNLYPLGDTHVGSLACDEKRNLELASIIAADPIGRVVGLGDFVEAVAPSDKRWSGRELPEYADTDMLENLFYRQAMRFCKLYDLTVGKWDVLIRGNHEQTAISRYFADPCAIIAERMKAKYIGDHEAGGWLVYLLKDDAGKTRAMVRVFIAHGWAGGELKGGTALALQRALLRKDADLLMLAHSHQAMAFPETVERVAQSGEIKTATRWGLVTFPLIEKHGYIARRGGNASPPGYSIVHLEAGMDNKLSISVEQRSL
jgi:hypothetical protein